MAANQHAPFILNVELHRSRYVARLGQSVIPLGWIQDAGYLSIIYGIIITQVQCHSWAGESK